MSETIEVYIGELQSLVSQGALVIDVREAEDSREEDCEIASDVKLPLSRLSELSSRLDTTKPVIFYCRSGMRSFQAAEIVARWTQKPAYYLCGGLLSVKLDS